MDDDRSISPASVASSLEELDSRSLGSYQPIFNPILYFNSIGSTTPIIRHNFKSIDALLSPIPTSAYKNGKTSFFIQSDDTGYNSQLLSSSSLSLQSRGSIDEEIKPTISSTPCTKKTNEKNNKTKKVRTAFTDDQKMNLDRFYATNRYPDPTEMEALSRLLSLDEKVIRVWFQNKRSREKNQSNPEMWQQYSSSIDFLH